MISSIRQWTNRFFFCFVVVYLWLALSAAIQCVSPQQCNKSCAISLDFLCNAVCLFSLLLEYCVDFMIGIHDSKYLQIEFLGQRCYRNVNKIRGSREAPNNMKSNRIGGWICHFWFILHIQIVRLDPYFMQKFQHCIGLVVKLKLSGTTWQEAKEMWSKKNHWPSSVWP